MRTIGLIDSLVLLAFFWAPSEEGQVRRGRYALPSPQDISYVRSTSSFSYRGNTASSRRGIPEFMLREYQEDLSRATNVDEAREIFYRFSGEIRGNTSKSRNKRRRGRRRRKGWQSYEDSRRPDELDDSRAPAPSLITDWSDANSNQHYNEATLEDAFNHFANLSNMAPCSQPQAVLVNVSATYSHLLSYYPSQVILHRCGVLGTCLNSNDKCVPANYEIVKLPFIVISGHMNVPQAKYLRFFNHTQCTCSASSGVTVCDGITTETIHHHTSSSDIWTLKASLCLPCPPPFISSNERCGCDCLDSDDECLNIKYGLDSMQQLSRRCVGEGECQIPPCSLGRYDQLCGTCPMSQPNIR